MKTKVLVLLVMMLPCVAFAKYHKGSSSTAEGLTYVCNNGHTAEVFGDETSILGVSASPDGDTAMIMVDSEVTPKENILYFGDKSEGSRLKLSQEHSRTMEGGDHAVHIELYGRDGNLLWSDNVCKAE